MTLAEEYQRQFRWRPWLAILDALPELVGDTVLDLGAGVGDQAAALVARGARVIGIEGNDELLRAAQARRLEPAEFHAGDLRALVPPSVRADGIWCSFTAAYFPDLAANLAAWATHLRPGGWIALTEVDDLFGHEPMSQRTRWWLKGYARDALAAGRYDFHLGRKLAGHLERAGFVVERTLVLGDRELAFDGPAPAEVVDAWRTRLDRMQLLRDRCGPEFERVRQELLDCLVSPDHRSAARVYCCLGHRKEEDP